MKHKNDAEYQNLGLKTSLQWLREKKVPNTGTSGMELWSNHHHNRSFVYYLPDQVHNASEEELELALEPYRQREQKRRKKRKEEEKKLWKEELELRYQQGVEDTTRYFQKKIDEIKMKNKVGIYTLAKSVLSDTLPEQKKRKIVYDVETTGLLFDEDEILQISIVDEEGNELINSYVKPYYMTDWPEAETIHGITKEMVENAPYAHQLIPLVRDIFYSANTWIAYNGNFDLAFLKFWGIEVTEHIKIEDVMFDFAPLYGEWNRFYESFKWQNLTKCAEFFDYKFSSHDSLEDVKATLHCYNCIQAMKKDGSYQEIVDKNYGLVGLQEL